MRKQHTHPSGAGIMAEAIRKLQQEVRSLRISQAPNSIVHRTTRGTALIPDATAAASANNQVVARWL
tara:strand:+ start:2562 stop:2762 length:201 start_codon:yes stop_codon:yes gene_type:complete